MSFQQPTKDLGTFELLPINAQIERLRQHVVSLHDGILETRRAIPNKKAIRAEAELAYAEKGARLEKLLDDAVRVLNLMVEKGQVTREELNQAISG